MASGRPHPAFAPYMLGSVEGPPCRLDVVAGNWRRSTHRSVGAGDAPLARAEHQTTLTRWVHIGLFAFILNALGRELPPPAKWTGHLARFVRRRIGPTFGAPRSTLNSSAEGVTITRSRSSTPCEGPTASDAANKALAAAAKRNQPEEPSAARARIAP